MVFAGEEASFAFSMHKIEAIRRPKPLFSLRAISIGGTLQSRNLLVFREPPVRSLRRVHLGTGGVFYCSAGVILTSIH